MFEHNNFIILLFSVVNAHLEGGLRCSGSIPISGNIRLVAGLRPKDMMVNEAGQPAHQLRGKKSQICAE